MGGNSGGGGNGGRKGGGGSTNGDAGQPGEVVREANKAKTKSAQALTELSGNLKMPSEWKNAVKDKTIETDRFGRPIYDW